ncbi:MAG TPA: alpha/beta hydrolase [Flavobacteriales bacterium]|nr:alpha/beta hydrolase [Flavobacteriales bacterium]
MITRAPLTTILGLSIVASGCNVARIHARKCVGRLERNDYTHHTFTDGSGAHFVWYRDNGRKKILLLHGYTGTGALQWSRSAKLLGDDYDAIMPDLLCHGQSTKDWGDTPGGNIDAQVAHVRSILDSLGVDERIDVVGSSYGGGVAARFAELHPERVKKLVIYDGLVSDYTAAMADSIARSIGADGMLAVMGTPTAKDLRYGIKLSLYRNPPLPGFVLRQIHEVNVEPFRPAQITLIKDLMAHEPLFATKRYDWKMPVYLIWGERDELIPNATGRAIMKRNNIPEEHWTTIPRTGHVANIERPKAFDRALRKILAE